MRKGFFGKNRLLGKSFLGFSALMTMLFSFNINALAEGEGEEISDTSIGIFEEYSVGDLNSEELLDNYISNEIEFAQNPVYMSSTYNGNKLDGINRIFYDKAKVMIAEVAAGERSSTICDVTVADLGGYKRYTAAELGVSSLVSGNSVSTEAMGAFLVKYGFDQFDINTLSDALLQDCPYERYWMGLKVSLDSPAQIAVYNEGGVQKIGFYENDDAKFCFKIAASKDYRAGNNEYAVDTNKTAAVKSTIDRVNDILNTAKSKNDRQKIEYYRDSICDLVEYNYDAGTLNINDATNLYGDPWQLVYVFDGNASTNVVCEGYSKAFKYLCDKTDFADSSINCYIATGNLGCEGHMWNIMHWSDGKNYLVDVTNCDGGHPKDDLFMAVPASGSVNGGYVFTMGGMSETYTYSELTRQTYSDAELTFNVASTSGLKSIFVDYDAYIVEGMPISFTVIREGGSNSCKFRLDSVTNADGNNILGDSAQYTDNNVFNVTFPAAGKYVLKFSAKDGDQEINGKSIEVDVKATSDVKNPANLSNKEQEAQVRAFVERFYTVVLGREGEADGINDWTNKLISKEKTGADVAKGFAMSKEFKNKDLKNDEFLKVMYKGFFDRDPDEGGYNGWMQKMNSGTSREAVIAGFVNSQEFKNLCAKYGINPGKMEVSSQGQQNNNNNNNNNSSALKLDASGVDDAQLDEYVERLYTKVLKRDSEKEGKEYWKNVIKNGKDDKGNVYDAATAARKGFFESKEYKNQGRTDDEFLEDLYWAFFNRKPDDEGYAYWQNKMKNEGYSRERVIDEGFGHSKEFKNLLTKYGFKILN